MDEETQKAVMKFFENVIYDPSRAELDTSLLPESHSQISRALVFLGSCAKEERAFAKELISGNLDATPPSVDNGLAASLKEIQGSLRHLRWQAREIAKGDYSQKIDFMGDLGDAFNLMSQQLKEREDKLIEEREALEAQNHELDNMQLMFTNLALDESRFIVITDEHTGEVIFRTNTAKEFKRKHPNVCRGLDAKLGNCPDGVADHMVTWAIDQRISEDGTEHHAHYSVRSYRLRWEEGHAIAHMVVNDTQEFDQHEEMEQLAFSDPLTNLHNRRYSHQLAQILYDEQRSFSIAFIDIDYLKYCNDDFGHEEGDRYLIALADLLKELPEPVAVCRVGGDEFMVIKEDVTKEEMEDLLEKARESFMGQEVPKGYIFKRSFSYGVVTLGPDGEMSLNEALEEADRRMYDYKVAHKKYLMRRYPSEPPTF